MATAAKRETLVFKSKAALQQHLLGDPLVVSPKDYDPERIDDSPKHREEMRRKLYGQRRSQYDCKTIKFAEFIYISINI